MIGLVLMCFLGVLLILLLAPFILKGSRKASRGQSHVRSYDYDSVMFDNIEDYIK